MTPRQRRMALVFGIIAGVGVAGALALSAFRSNVTFFFDPTQVSQGQVKTGEHFRLGGMVTEGSVKRVPGSLEVRFVVTDFKHEVPVSYTGVLPDLFREGTGVVAHGHMANNGTFVADEVLAKHDEKYMPPEVAKSLKRRHGEARDAALQEPANTGSGAAAQTPAPNGGAQAEPPSTTSTQTPATNEPATNAPAANSAPIASARAQSAMAPAREAISAPAGGPASTPTATAAAASGAAAPAQAPVAQTRGGVVARASGSTAHRASVGSQASAAQTPRGVATRAPAPMESRTSVASQATTAQAIKGGVGQPTSTSIPSALAANGGR